MGNKHKYYDVIVAWANTNRNFIGIELDENYFNIAKERIESAYNKDKAQ